MCWQYLCDIAYTYDSTNEVFRPHRIKAKQNHELVDQINKINALRIKVGEQELYEPAPKLRKPVKRISSWSTMATVLEPEIFKRIRAGCRPMPNP